MTRTEAIAELERIQTALTDATKARLDYAFEIDEALHALNLNPAAAADVRRIRTRAGDVAAIEYAVIVARERTEVA